MASGSDRNPIIIGGLPSQVPDFDPEETQEWLDSLDAAVDERGRERARYLMLRLIERAREKRVAVPEMRSTDYVNTIATKDEPFFPGNEEIERKILNATRWNAAVMVSRAQRPGIGVGGHIATFASSASLYDVGFNHFFRGKDEGDGGDQIFFQGHASPGIYARAFLLDRLSEQQLDAFRQEKSKAPYGLSSYPHPRLMPDFWEFPTVSMGLGPLGAIYQARMNRYMEARGIADTSKSHVWAFLGDGEMDEPESLGQLSIAAREGLDNLTFVVNCNLQRLDGPVRGNGKIIQELESQFRGAGWNVIKLVWDRSWDPLLAQDRDGILVNKLNTTPDGQFQTYATETGAYIREHFFGDDQRLRAMVENMTDDQILHLGRGGHDHKKVYAAYAAAKAHKGQPTVILAQTVKGWTLGPNFEGRNATHQMKKLTVDDLKRFRDRLHMPITDKQLESGAPPYYHPGRDSEEIQYMHDRRKALGGYVPTRVVRAKPLAAAGRQDVRGREEGLRPAVDRHHHGVRPAAQGPHAGQGDRQALRADRAGRVPHLRHGLVLPEREDLQPAGPAVRGGGPRSAARVQGVADRPDAARRHLRGGLHGLADRGGFGVRHARRAADPGVRLLLDVRFPAHRRPVLADGRPARARLRAGRDRRPYDADR